MKRYKSAITGEFVTKKFAKENPDTTVEMTMDNSKAVIEKVIDFLQDQKNEFSVFGDDLSDYERGYISAINDVLDLVNPGKE